MITALSHNTNFPTPSRQIRCILCPTDLSSTGDEALRYAVPLSRSLKAQLLLCYALENATDSQNNLDHRADRQQIERLFTESLGPYLSSADQPPLSWAGFIGQGEAAEVIAQIAAEQRADLILLRSRHRPLSATFLGSTAETLCRTAPCPVLVTHPQERIWAGFVDGKVHLKRLLVAYDLSEYSELALSYAISLAQEYQAELHLIYVLPTSLENAWFPITEDQKQKALEQLDYALPNATLTSVTVKRILAEGKPYREILGYAEENQIDLICMGAHGAGFGKWSLLGSNVDRVLRQTGCPVLVARPLRPTSTLHNENS
jgi:nucleotide-binding universal stress UspA family protein